MTETLVSRFAVVTGASSGIGLELARCCARDGFHLLIAADEPEIVAAAKALSAEGAQVESVVCDLATAEGIDVLVAAIGEREVDALLANAGRGLGRAFLDQDFVDIRRVIDTNVTGTVDLVQRVVRRMRARGQGKVLITGSIAGLMPGTFQAVYNGTKAFIDSFAWALRNELKDTGVSVTCLMPGPTDTEFFERADMLDTKIGQDDKDDPADVARDGFEALMNGDERVESASLKTKLQGRASRILPDSAKAAMHRSMAEPGSGDS